LLNEIASLLAIAERPIIAIRVVRWKNTALADLASVSSARDSVVALTVVRRVLAPDSDNTFVESAGKSIVASLVDWRENAVVYGVACVECTFDVVVAIGIDGVVSASTQLEIADVSCAIDCVITKGIIWRVLAIKIRITSIRSTIYHVITQRIVWSKGASNVCIAVVYSTGDTIVAEIMLSKMLTNTLVT